MASGPLNLVGQQLLVLYPTPWFYVVQKEAVGKVLTHFGVARDFYLKINEPLTIEIIEEHLKGQKTLAVPVVINNFCKYVIIDYDGKRPGDFYAKVAKTLPENTFFPLPSKSFIEGHVHYYIPCNLPRNKAKQFLNELEAKIHEPKSTYQVKPNFETKTPEGEAFEIISLPFHNAVLYGEVLDPFYPILTAASQG